MQAHFGRVQSLMIIKHLDNRVHGPARAHAATLARVLLLLCLCTCTVAGRVLTQQAGLYLPVIPNQSPNLPASSPGGVPGLYVPIVQQPAASPSPPPAEGGVPQQQQPSPFPPPAQQSPAVVPPAAGTSPPASPSPANPEPASPSSPDQPSPSATPSPSQSPGDNPAYAGPGVTTGSPTSQQPGGPSPTQPQPQPQQPGNEAGPANPNPQPASPGTGGPGAPAAVVGTGANTPTTSNTSGTAQVGSSGSLSRNALVGIIVGAAGAVVLAAAICAAVLVRRSRKRKRKAAAGAAPKPPPNNVASFPSAFGSSFNPHSDSNRWAGLGPPDGGGSVTLLPEALTVPTPPVKPVVPLADAPARWSSGPAALADSDITPVGPERPPAAAGSSPRSPAAAGTGLEGWLAHSAAAATAANTPGAAGNRSADAVYPPINRDERAPPPGYYRGPQSAAHPQDHWLTPAIPEDRAVGDNSSAPDAVRSSGANGPGRRRSSGDQNAGRIVQGRPASPRSPPAAAAAAAAAQAAGARGSESGQPTSSSAVSLGPFGAVGVQSQRMSWEQMIQRSGSGAAAGSGGSTGAQDSAFKRKQQMMIAADTDSVADIGASPFAHLFGAAATDLGSSIMSRDASGALSPLPPQSGAAAAQGHPLAVQGVRATNVAAAPAGATGSAPAAPRAARAAEAGPSYPGVFGSGPDAGDSAVPAYASPFATGCPSRDDGSLSAAVAATAASVSTGGLISGGTTPEGHSRVSGYSSGSGYKPGSRPPRYSTDTGTSSYTAATGQSWTSNASSNTPAARKPTQPAPATPSAAASVSPFAQQGGPASLASPAGRTGPGAAGAASPMRTGSNAAGGGSPAGGGGLVMQASVAAKPTRYMSGPRMDPHWDFGQSGVKPVRVLLQVNDEEEDHPVTLILMCSAPPPRPEVLAQIVLPSDPPNAGVDLAIDANRDLAFPSNSFLGAGAFGQVHRALYRGRHPVAVKMLTDPGLRSPDEDTLRSFREELQIMAKLDHPHILRCYGGNLEGTNPFIVTELCECSLDKMILYYKKQHGTGLPLRHTLTVGLHVASALWHLHPSIVHRDLKPQNVLLDINGTAKVADFGLSRIKTHTYLSTQHVTAGTASYMSPECFAGGHVGEKADVYSLGCMLWECVTGERPWRGLNVVQVAYQVAMAKNRPPLPPVDPVNCPHELVTLLDDCFSFNPRERPSSGEVMKLMAHMIRTHLPDA